MSSLHSAVAACPNCRLETFTASSQMEMREGLILRPYDITGQLCEEHSRTLFAMASSTET